MTFSSDPTCEIATVAECDFFSGRNVSCCEAGEGIACYHRDNRVRDTGMVEAREKEIEAMTSRNVFWNCTVASKCEGILMERFEMGGERQEAVIAETEELFFF